MLLPGTRPQITHEPLCVFGEIAIYESARGLYTLTVPNAWAGRLPYDEPIFWLPRTALGVPSRDRPAVHWDSGSVCRTTVIKYLRLVARHMQEPEHLLILGPKPINDVIQARRFLQSLPKQKGTQ